MVRRPERMRHEPQRIPSRPRCIARELPCMARTRVHRMDERPPTVRDLCAMAELAIAWSFRNQTHDREYAVHANQFRSGHPHPVVERFDGAYVEVRIRCSEGGSRGRDHYAAARVFILAGNVLSKINFPLPLNCAAKTGESKVRRIDLGVASSLVIPRRLNHWAVSQIFVPGG